MYQYPQDTKLTTQGNGEDFYSDFDGNSMKFDDANANQNNNDVAQNSEIPRELSHMDEA